MIEETARISPSKFIFTFKEEEIAYQITLIDFKLFHAIKVLQILFILFPLFLASPFTLFYLQHLSPFPFSPFPPLPPPSFLFSSAPSLFLTLLNPCNSLRNF